MLKTTHPECIISHHFETKKIHKFSGKGHSPSPDPTPLAAYRASILASSALDLRPPNVPVALTPMQLNLYRTETTSKSVKQKKLKTKKTDMPRTTVRV